MVGEIGDRWFIMLLLFVMIDLIAFLFSANVKVPKDSKIDQKEKLVNTIQK